MQSKGRIFSQLLVMISVYISGHKFVKWKKLYEAIPFDQYVRCV